jgi:hypothetical protein
MVVHMTGRRSTASRSELLRLARHYQDLAWHHRDEERFWLCRASYFGRLSRNQSSMRG